MGVAEPNCFTCRSHARDRSRYLPPSRSAEALCGGLDRRPDQRAVHVHGRSGHPQPTADSAREAETGGLPAPLHPRFPHRHRRGEGEAPDGRRGAPAGEGLRPDPGPQVRLCHQRHGDHRVRLPDGAGAGDRRVPHPRGTLVAPPCRAVPHRRPGSHAVPHALLPSARKAPPLLPANRHPPGRGGDPPGADAGAADDGDRHGQDARGVPDMLDALERPLEPAGGTAAQAENPLPRRPQHPRGRPEGQGLHPLR